MYLILKITWRGSAPARAFRGWVADAIGVKIGSATVVRESSRKSLQLNMLSHHWRKTFILLLSNDSLTMKICWIPTWQCWKHWEACFLSQKSHHSCWWWSSCPCCCCCCCCDWCLISSHCCCFLWHGQPRSENWERKAMIHLFFCHNKILLHVTTKRSIVTWE